MKGSFKLGRFWGVDVFVHFTFILLLLLWAGIEWSNSGDLTRSLNVVALVCAIFGCVTLHEYGHILTARKFGIQTRDIILFPIGGIARLERMPDKPGQELLVALAGPAVNAGLAIALYFVLQGLDRLEEIGRVRQFRGELMHGITASVPFLTQLFYANVIMGLFNLIPAFPMDGGRVLRAFLSMRMDYPRATRIAARVGQALALAIGFAGFHYGQYLLLFTSLFVWIGAARESEDVEMRSTLQGYTVDDAMLTSFATLRPEQTARDAAALILAGSQPDFPVVEDGRVVGLLTRKDLVQALVSQPADGDLPLAKLMCRSFPACHTKDPLEECLQVLRESGLPLMPVLDAGIMVGILTPENIGEFLLLRGVIRPRRLSPR